MPWPCEKTHRCKGSVAAKVSIRKNAAISILFDAGIYSGWSLCFMRYDTDYMCYHNYLIAQIKHCPFCGTRLEDA